MKVKNSFREQMNNPLQHSI